MAKRRFLPKYVSSFKDRHGKERYRCRAPGQPTRYFKAALGTPDFLIEYRTFLDAQPAEAEPIAVMRPAPGSIADLVARYFAVPTRLGPSPVTQAKVRRIIGGFSQDYGALPVNRVGFEHIETILNATLVRRMEKTSKGLRPVGGPEAAKKLRKELVRLFAFAVRLKMIATNPAAETARLKVAAEDLLCMDRERHRRLSGTSRTRHRAAPRDRADAVDRAAAR